MQLTKQHWSEMIGITLITLVALYLNTPQAYTLTSPLVIIGNYRLAKISQQPLKYIFTTVALVNLFCLAGSLALWYLNPPQ